MSDLKESLDLSAKDFREAAKGVIDLINDNDFSDDHNETCRRQSLFFTKQAELIESAVKRIRYLEENQC